MQWRSGQRSLQVPAAHVPRRATRGYGTYTCVSMRYTASRADGLPAGVHVTIVLVCTSRINWYMRVEAERRWEWDLAPGSWLLAIFNNQESLLNFFLRRSARYSFTLLKL